MRKCSRCGDTFNLNEAGETRCPPCAAEIKAIDKRRAFTVIEGGFVPAWRLHSLAKDLTGGAA